MMNTSNRLPTTTSNMNPNQQRRHISREFKKRGLSIQPAALSALLNVLRREEEQRNIALRTNPRSNHSGSRNSSSGSSGNNNKDALHILVNEIKERMINYRGDDRRINNQSTKNYTSYNSSIVTLDILQTVVADLSRDGNDVLDEALQLLNAWKMKRLDYNVMKKRWKLKDEMDETRSGGGNASQEKNTNPGRSVFGLPSDKVNMLLQRYHFIQQRILRQEIFQNKLSINYASSSSANILHNEQHKITPIEGLLGTTDTKTLLGIITQIEQNQYYLEDPTSSIPLDLSQVQYPSTDGFITENSIVLVEGQMSSSGGEMLIVHTIGHPMYESREDAIEHIGLQNTNIFDAVPNLNELNRLQNEEMEHGSNVMFVLLSDVHLDDINVLEKLEVLFQGFDGIGDEDEDDDDDPLPVFILMGDFASTYPSTNSGGCGHASGGRSSNSSSMSHTAFVTNLFDELANIITKFPKIAKNGRFVLIPSMNDIGMGNILPRPPLPRHFLKGLQSKVTHVHLASNPCRLRYFSKEIVLSRFDVLSKLRRSSILPPKPHFESENDDDEEDSEMADETNSNDMDRLIQHSMKTVLDQGHLCPVPLQSTPIYWQYDHAMSLYPPPDILVMGESTTKPYSEKYENDVDVMNPGPFYVDYKFLVIKPCDVGDDSDEVFVNVEFSQVP